MESIEFATPLSNFKGNEKEGCFEFLGVPFAIAKRFEYAELVSSYPESFDATKPGNACPQTRTYYEHLEIPERMFYHREFRENIVFQYNEDCLNLNIYCPKEKGSYPVLVFIHGGGFDSGANSESPFDGEAYAKQGIVTVFLQYRVGVLGYLTHEEIFKQYGRDGNFGLDDQVKGLEWVKKHIHHFYGDPSRVTVAGQSAGAMSIQYMLCNPELSGLFEQAILMSGGGKFPDFSLPKPCEVTREYWLDYLSECHVSSLGELKALPEKELFDAIQRIKSRRKDNVYNTMPVIDGKLIPVSIKEAIKHPNQKPFIIGYTNCDMYALLMALISQSYANKNHGYSYFFDVNAPGDDNLAFHSSDLRYAFGTLERSWRPYGEEDQKISQDLISYFSAFIKTGNPNVEGLPEWKKDCKKALCLSYNGYKMGKAKKWPLLKNTINRMNPR